MKVGILTFYHVRNIGACLQAFAMKEVLENEGHEVYFVKGYDRKFALQLFINDTGRMWPWKLPFIIKKEAGFRSYFKRFRTIETDRTDEMDCVVIGSDSLWASHYGKTLTPSSFLGDIVCKRIGSYAVSVGGEYSLSTYTEKQKECLRKLDFYTCRDTRTYDFIREVCGVEAELVCDPTMLIDWKNIVSNYNERMDLSNSIVVYGGLSKNVIKFLKEYAEKNSYSLVNIGIYNRNFPVSTAVSPDEFIYVLDRAKYVITSMFHGVMLAVGLNKQFRYISMDPKRDIKLGAAVDALGLRDYCIKPKVLKDGYEIFEKKIDYDIVNERKNNFSEKSKNTLLSNIWGGVLLGS